ncbi:protein MpABCC1 [Marchantia polymorpha subsp. ruderalis]
MHNMAGTLDENLAEPLLENSCKHAEERLRGYEDAGFFSRLVFSWMNDLLWTGSKRALEVTDIPRMGPNDNTEACQARFYDRWEHTPAGNRNLAIVLGRAHMGLLCLTGALGILRLCVMYAGPLLIQRFIDFTAQEDSMWFDGAKLVAFLFVAKTLEVWADHQYNFQEERLGISIWSALVSTVYSKGLKISATARTTHGVGKIVNYMSVDSRELSTLATRVHDLWMMPIQICLALVILYGVVGIATLAGVGTMVGVMVLSMSLASKQMNYQVNTMAARDYRLKVTNEAISHMKIIKLCNWETIFLQRVEDARAKEKMWVSKANYVISVAVFFLWLAPSAVSVSTFGTCIYLGIPLTPGKVFTAIATFRILQEPLRSFPQLIMAGAQALVAARRLTTYFESKELDSGAVERLPLGVPDGDAVVVKGGAFKWELVELSPTLSNINLQVKRGSLVAVVGTVGSGKSALLSCMLGEMERVSGTVTVSGKVAYVSQSAWIQNGTIKDNILFGKHFDEALYNDTVRVCALEGDLMQLTYGDDTEIGERGINLSGGQKQRIQLARAVYQEADVYLLDDIFSAVDAHTGSSLFQECVRGTLKSKTLLLVTHQVEFLRGADLILVMRDGGIAQSGTYDYLHDQGLDFSALVNAHNESLSSHEDAARNASAKSEDLQETENSDLFYSTLDMLEPSSAGLTTSLANASIQEALTVLSQQLLNEQEGDDKKTRTQRRADHASECKPALAPPASESSRLIAEEGRGKGQVGLAIYWAYITKVLFGSHVISLLLIQTGWQALQISSDYWLADSTATESQQSLESSSFMEVYAELAVGSGLFVLARTILITFSGLKTSQKFFQDMIRSVFRAPMSFFDTTPSGRLLTRSSTDQVSLDFDIPFGYGSTLAMLFQLLGVLTVMSQVTLQMVTVIVPMGVIFYFYSMYYISTSRELTRLDSVTEAPVIQSFTETISGSSTIRAFSHQDRFLERNLKLVDTNLAVKFHAYASSEWLGSRLEFLGTIGLCVSALLLVVLPKGLIRPELVGLSLSYGLALNSCLLSLVLAICTVEQKMVAVERILQYSKLSSEAPLVIPDRKPPPNWPAKGSITMTNVQMRYRADMPLVLKGVSFSVKGGEKLGVVGRTGSGKSSLIQVLFRLVELAGGSIVIDGIDITRLGLSDLRSKLSIIPQEPTLFEGNVRSNLDPLGEHTDAEIWDALEKSQLADVVRDKESGLDFPVAENGQNWSMGQRQLFCLGRALLRRSTILVLDEATASVDTQTDVLLQKTINREFAASTVLSIAHRIPSVMDSDKVLVLDDGLVLEFGSPTSLLENPSSFAALVREYWNRSNSLHELVSAGRV